MNILLEKNIISELKNGTNFGYIFRNKEQFSLTEYKVLKNVFIKCMKMLYNGKIELFYILDGWKSLESIAANINENSFLTIMTNILASIIDVRNNGFLSCQNIDISFDKIYIDPNTLKVRLVYVPCKERIFEDYLIFENTLRTELIKFIQCHAMEGIKTERFAMELSDGMLSLKDLYNHLKGVKSSVETKTVKLETKSFSTRLRFVAINAPFRCELVVDKSEFVERFPELSLFYRLFSPLNSEMICIFPYFCPYAESAREIRGIFVALHINNWFSEPILI